MNENLATMSNNCASIPAIPSTSPINQPAKMKINPLQLLTALSILLNMKGGIKSFEEVKRVAGLMGKYSKKLVSKCIYLNILEATDANLLNQFYAEAGWDLVSTWLTDAMSICNWPLTKQILDLLLVSPVTVERLKQNNAPKMVKDLSKDCDNYEVKKVAELVVQNWKAVVVQGSISTSTSAANSVPELPGVESLPVVQDNTNNTPTIDYSALIEETASVHPSVEAVPKRGTAKRGRGARTARGRGRPRGRPKVETPSYADLLTQDLDKLSGHDTPINITIRNGSKVLAKVSSRKSVKRKKVNRNLIESSDSEDNLPLSLIRKDAQASIDLTGEETEVSAEPITIESSDSPPQSDASANSVVNTKNEDQVEASVKKENVNVEVNDKSSSAGKSKDKESDRSKDRHRSKSGDNDRHRDKNKRDGERNKDKSGERSRDKSKDIEKNRSKSKDSDRNRTRSSSDKSKESEKSRDKSRERDRKSHHRSKDRSKEKSDSGRTADKRKEEEKSTGAAPSDQKEVDQVTLSKVKPLSTEGLAKIPRKPSSFLDALGAADSDVQEQKKPAIKTKSRGFRSTGLLDETINPPGMAGKRISNPTSPNLKRQRLPELSFADKRVKTSVSSDPSAFDRPGGIKLISPKRPAIADDGGFMAALTAPVPERKRILKKRRSSDSDPKPDSNKVPKLELEEAPADDKNKPGEIAVEVKKEEPMLSPTSIRPTFNYYKERVPDEVPKKEKPKEENPEPQSPPGDEEMEFEENEETAEDEDITPEPAVPAPAQEDYETIEVMHTCLSDHLRSALVSHHGTINKHKKKGVRWKTEENLTQTFFFPMDENERVNVNTLKFQDMMQRDRAFEKELMGKHRGRFGSPDLNPNPVDTCTEFLPWKLYAIHLSEESTVIYGVNSKEKHIQAQREHLTMEMFFHPAMRPDTPSEPDQEMVQRSEPFIVPLQDVTGTDSHSDHRNIPWPEPVVNPPEMPFMPPPANQMPSHDGGHWLVGSHPTPRFGGDMFTGPGVCGPPLHPGQGFPGQNFGNNMRGPGPQQGWGPPHNDYNGPHVLLSGGPPPPHMGPNMGGPGMGQPGPPMGMPGPMPGRGGPRFKRGNWGQQNSRPCKHFMNGHCRNGNNCRFAHNQHR